MQHFPNIIEPLSFNIDMIRDTYAIQVVIFQKIKSFKNNSSNKKSCHVEHADCYGNITTFGMLIDFQETKIHTKNIDAIVRNQEKENTCGTMGRIDSKYYRITHTNWSKEKLQSSNVMTCNRMTIDINTGGFLSLDFSRVLCSIWRIINTLYWITCIFFSVCSLCVMYACIECVPFELFKCSSADYDYIRMNIQKTAS